MEKELDKNFEDSLNSFDFHKVERVMELLNWRWVTDGGLEIPSILEMRDTVISLYKNILRYYEPNTQTAITSAGGFEVSRFYDADNETYDYAIKFVVESSYV